MNEEKQLAQLIITCADNSQDAVIRIFNNEGEQIFYTSTRIAGLKRNEGGYVLFDADDFTGMKYELKLLETKKVLTGTVDNENSNSKLE